MGSTITVGFTFFFLAVSIWAANLVCYHPQYSDSVNPLVPINTTVAWN